MTGDDRRYNARGAETGGPLPCTASRRLSASAAADGSGLGTTAAATGAISLRAFATGAPGDRCGGNVQMKQESNEWSGRRVGLCLISTPDETLTTLVTPINPCLIGKCSS